MRTGFRKHLKKMGPNPTPSLTSAEEVPSVSASFPLYARFDSSHLTIGAGVAIFHLATSRVVLCWHTRERYWFLPKGRRDVHEETGCGAEREGYEEVFAYVAISAARFERNH